MRILSMCREFIVNCGAVSIAQRNRRRIRGKTFPQQLDEAKSVLDGEFQNLNNVGITHREHSVSLIRFAR